MNLRMLTTLPVSRGPAQCLATISVQMRVVKQSGQAIGAQALTELSGFAPPTLLHEAFRLVVARQRLVDLVVTNVPGPQFPLYLDGRELTDIFPMVPLGSNLNLGIAIVSYNGALNFGLVGDFAVMHDLEDLADDVLASPAGPHSRCGRTARREGRRSVARVRPTDGARHRQAPPRHW